MFSIKITKTKNRFRAYPTHQAVQTSGSTADIYNARLPPRLLPQHAQNE
jgi:hypothetical protein